MPKTLLSWSEPFFFVSRLRTRKQWLLRLVSVVAIALACLVAMRFFRGGPIPWTMELRICLIAGVGLTFLPDLLHLHRDVWVSEDKVGWMSNAGQYSRMGSFPLADVTHIELFRPGEWQFQFGGIQLHLRNGTLVLFAIPNTKKLETVATVFHRMEIPISLSDWEPTTADSRMHVQRELAIDNQAATTDAVFLPLPPEEPKLVSLWGQILAALPALIPLLIALGAMIGTWVYLWLHWSQLSVVQRALIGGAGVGGLILCFKFVAVVGQCLESRIMVGFAKQTLRSRMNPLVDAEAPEVHQVSVYPRERWTKMICQSADFGFLQFDRRKRALVFEGNKERWTIPLTALSALRMEEAEVGKEGADTVETRVYVVLGTQRDGAPWEVGLTRPHTQWGADGVKTRRSRMGELFEELQTAIALA